MSIYDAMPTADAKVAYTDKKQCSVQSSDIEYYCMEINFVQISISSSIIII